jgi:hypothetical protein
MKGSKMKNMIKNYRLGSSSLCNAVGMMRWAKAGYEFEDDRPQLLNVMSAWEGVPAQVLDAALKGELAYTEQGDAVYISGRDIAIHFHLKEFCQSSNEFWFCANLLDIDRHEMPERDSEVLELVAAFQAAAADLEASI